MRIKTTSKATRAMTLAFKLSMSAPGRSGARGAEMRATAKTLITAAENYVSSETAKFYRQSQK